jgi:hypothetical protein
MGQRFANSRQRGRVHTQLRRRDGSCVCARDAYSHSYTNCNSYCDANSHAYSDTKRHTDCHTNIYAEASPDPQASPHSTAKALG